MSKIWTKKSKMRKITYCWGSKKSKIETKKSKMKKKSNHL